MGLRPDMLNPSFSRSTDSLPVVYSRDFAYADSAPILVLDPYDTPGMAPVRADVNTASAKTFAEYVIYPHTAIITPEL